MRYNFYQGLREFDVTRREQQGSRGDRHRRSGPGGIPHHHHTDAQRRRHHSGLRSAIQSRRFDSLSCLHATLFHTSRTQ